MNILITGSNGFIGRYLANELSEEGHMNTLTYRSLPDDVDLSNGRNYAIGNIDAQTQWQVALKNIDAIVHLAARVHIMHETEADPLSAFRKVNTQGTINLARQATMAGVRRFIYLSTIKVNGEKTLDSPFYADDRANPQDPYAISKYEAEQQLLALGKETGLEVVIIRPPLVYGPGVKGNFMRLITMVKKSIPLPLAKIQNTRSLVNIQNLCSLIKVCLVHPKARAEVFLVSDGHDLSTTELFQNIANALGKRSRLFYLHPSIIHFFAHLLMQDAEFERLFGSLHVDISKNEQLLGWKPIVSIEEGIRQAVL